MSLKEYQNVVDEWTRQFTPQYWEPHQIYARLGEECGELAREINHLYGSKPKKKSEEISNLKDEIGDIIFTLICLANSKGINLDEAFLGTMEKYRNRDNDRFTKK